MFGAYDADLFEYRECLVDRAQSDAGILALDDQVDVLGRRMPLRLQKGLEDGPALGGKGVAGPAQFLPDVGYEHARCIRLRCLLISNHSDFRVYHTGFFLPRCTIAV